jgi:tripeptidyl-peptidase-1
MDASYPNTNWNLGYQGKLQCGVYKPTNVISISYGSIEDLLPNNYLYRQCNEYMKLGLQGVTIIAASGDSGVASADGCAGNNGTVFAPSFPASCPYVLSVGSTELDLPNDQPSPKPWQKLEEVSTARFYSGGGFSNIFNVSDYQKKAVEEYFSIAESSFNFSSFDEIIVNGVFPPSLKADQVYHRGGRGFPDVSVVGDRQLMVWDNEWGTIGGTSMSAPIWASLLTLINEKRIAAGKGTLGFVNPILVSAIPCT